VNVRRLPIDPPWLIIPFIAGVVPAAAMVSNDGSFVLTWAGALVALAAGAFGLDRSCERNRLFPPR
jgi:hypothetical protein